MTLKPNAKTPEELSADPASQALIRKARGEGVAVCFTRVETQKTRCQFGMQGACCRNCNMGPCRLSEKSPRGVCGADADTVVARNFLRQVASGAAAHSDHARHLCLLLKKVALAGLGAGSVSDIPGGYAVRDEAALRRIAASLGIESSSDENKNALAARLADFLLREFSVQEEPLNLLRLAPGRRASLWQALGVDPKGIDRMVVEAVHRAHIGVDHEPKNLLLHAFRTALADGWGGSRIGTMVSDILFGTPAPVKSRANLGVLRPDTVNVLVHGHEPALSEMLAFALRDPEIQDRARAAGAKGLTLAGICCTANEVLMRHGIPAAGNFLQQELAIVTGAVELMVTDIQCVMPSLPEVAAHYHTIIVSTSEIARTTGAEHKRFDHDRALACAKELLLQAIDNYSRRDQTKVAIPDATRPLVAGFSVEAIRVMLGGHLRATFRPLNDAVIAGRIKGLVGIVGCNNARTKQDEYINVLTRELIARDVLVLQTGCAALASAKAGMLTPEAALAHAGPGLREVCEAVGLPPVLHMGSCVDNSRILEAATAVLAEGGLGEDLSDLPAVGAAPEWMSEKAVAIGCYFVASGVDVVLGSPFNVGGSPVVDAFLKTGAKDLFGASFHVEEDPLAAADLIMGLLQAKRVKLGIDRAAQRKLFDMKDRRSM